MELLEKRFFDFWTEKKDLMSQDESLKGFSKKMKAVSVITVTLALLGTVLLTKFMEIIFPLLMAYFIVNYIQEMGRKNTSHDKIKSILYDLENINIIVPYLKSKIESSNLSSCKEILDDFILSIPKKNISDVHLKNFLEMNAHFMQEIISDLEPKKQELEKKINANTRQSQVDAIMKELKIEAKKDKKDKFMDML